MFSGPDQADATMLWSYGVIGNGTKNSFNLRRTGPPKTYAIFAELKLPETFRGLSRSRIQVHDESVYNTKGYICIHIFLDIYIYVTLRYLYWIAWQVEDLAYPGVRTTPTA